MTFARQILCYALKLIRNFALIKDVSYVLKVKNSNICVNIIISPIIPQSCLFLNMLGTHGFYIGAKLMKELVEIYLRLLLGNLQKYSYLEIYFKICTLTCKSARLPCSDFTSSFLLASLRLRSSFLEIAF